MGVLPMAVFGLEVPAGGMPVAASGDIPAAVSFFQRHHQLSRQQCLRASSSA